ncbi:MAG: phage tail sheath family protein [Pseudonocardiaceae bacterium]
MHTIVGVSTSVTAFVGGASKGPAGPVRVFSFSDYLRTFGPPLDEAQPMGHAVQHFFTNGGSQAVIVRALGSDAKAATADLESTELAESSGTVVLTLTANGKGTWANMPGSVGLQVEVDRAAAANPNDAFNLVLRYLTLDPRTNIAVVSAIESHTSLSMSPKHPRYVLNVLGGSQLVIPSVPTSLSPEVEGYSLGGDPIDERVPIKVGTKTLQVAVDFGPRVDLVLFPTETSDVDKNREEIRDAINIALADMDLGATAELPDNTLKIVSNSTGLDSAVNVTPAPGDISKLLKLGPAWGGTEVSGSATSRPETTPPDMPQKFTGGLDGSIPVSHIDIVPENRTGGIFALGSLLFPRFNLLCLPGVTSTSLHEPQVATAMSYCKDERAFLIVDSPAEGFDSLPPSLGGLTAVGEHGAIYYPRLTVVETLAGGTTRTLNLPACGAVAGVMARIDTARGIWKAPAGREAGIAGVSGLTADTDDNISGLLNPKGVNVLRAFPGAGIVVWGARTLKGDDTASSEFKYVPVRRLTDFIAGSLYLGTQFAVFEPNDPDLHAQLRLAVGSFMRGLFRQGAFQQSEKRAESDSFFVKCDAEVNPQSEIDLGRVNVVVGFAPLKPAEFVMITIEQISQLEA